MTKKEMFAKGNITKTIFKLSIPLVVSQIINVLYNIVDRIYIGNMPIVGKDALAGLGIAFPVIMIVSAFAALFGMGGAPIASIKLGEGNDKEAKKTMLNSFVMLMIFGVILTIVLLIFDDQILYLFGATDDIINYSKGYLNIYALGTTSVMLTLGLNAYITAQGNTTIAMITVLIGAVTNIILDPILIYGFNLGVEGAALATIISQTFSAIFSIWFLTSNKSLLKLNFKNFKLDYKIILAIIALGISPFVMQSTESFVQITFNVQIKAYGGDNYINYINLITIFLSFMQVIMLPLAGFTQGSTPMVSYNYGAGNMDRVRKTFKVVFITTIIYTLSFYIIIFAIPTTLTRIFNSDPTLLKLSPRLFRIFFIGIAIIGIQITCQNTFMALKQSLTSLLLAMLRKIILLIPLTLILPKYLGINGVFYAEPIADVIAVIVTGLVFILSFNKILDKKAARIEFEKLAEPLL